MSEQDETGSIRVCIQQPALPAYRVPVFAELASRPGISVEVLFSDKAKLPNVEAQGFEARQVGERLLLGRPREVRWTKAQFEAVDPKRADVAILEYNAGVPSLVPAIRRAKRRGVGVVLWGHGYSVRDSKWSRGLRNLIGRRADAVLLYNHEARERMIEDGFPADKLFVALNALDQGPIQAAREAWLADHSRLADFKREHGLDDRPVVLFVSRLVEQNRTDLLLHAVARLADAQPDLVLAIVGDGDQRAHLGELAERLGIADRVRMPGAIYGEDALAPWFLSARVFAYPAYMGLSVLHAFGYGLPVVTSGDMSCHGPEASAVVDGENGRLVDLGEPGSLAGAVGQILADDELQGRLAAGALRTATERQTISGMVDGHEAAVRFAHRKALERARNR